MNKLTQEERADWRLSGYVLIVAIIAMVLALFFAKPARADVNLPAICTSGGSHGSTACDAVKYDYPAPTDLVKIATAQYFPWAGMKLTSTVIVCGSDVARGATSCPQVAYVLRSALPDGPPSTPPTGTFVVRAAWQAPTVWADDGSPMPESEIVGYVLTWKPEAGGAGGEIKLPPSALGHTLTLPAVKVCLSIITEGKLAFSDATLPVCIEPKARKPGMPASVTVTFGTP